MTFEVLSAESLDKMFSFIFEGRALERIYQDFDNLKEELGLTLVPTTYIHLGALPPLVLPNDSAESRTATDVENILIVRSAMANLKPAHATDPRLWATLSLTHWSEYVSKRWPAPSGAQKLKRHLASHWLCKPGMRSRMRENAIARLWWMGHLASQIEGWSVEEVSSLLLSNSDYRQQLLDRSTSVTMIPVFTAILTLTKEANMHANGYDRPGFRLFMEQVNYIAMRTNLGCLNHHQVTSMLRPVFSKYLRLKN